MRCINSQSSRQPTGLRLKSCTTYTLTYIFDLLHCNLSPIPFRPFLFPSSYHELPISLRMSVSRKMGDSTESQSEGELISNAFRTPVTIHHFKVLKTLAAIQVWKCLGTTPGKTHLILIPTTFYTFYNATSYKTKRSRWLPMIIGSKPTANPANDTVDGRNPAPPGMYKTL